VHVLVPQKIIREYQAGNRSGEFQAVGLFVDITGFSKLTNDLMQLGQHGAEILANLMREAFTPLVNSVYAHHGFIATFAGDAFTALFPLDQGTEHADRHALSAAWEIQQLIAEKSFQVNGAQIAVSTRVGLACGGVNWGIVTSGQANRAIYYFRGDAVENCAEAEGLAEAGETIIDSATHARLQPFILCEEISNHYRVVSVNETIPGSVIPQQKQLDLETSSLFYPQELITQTSSGEFRQIVNMFINLPTVRTEEQLSIFMQYLFRLQDQYGGLLNRIDFGDKGSHLLLFWGAPVAYKNDIGRALNFILTLQTETSIPIKAGITYTIAHAGFIGAPLREEYTCYGQGVNLAARFMTAAPRGEVWIDEPIAKRVAKYFDVEFIDVLALKGFEEKQKVYALFERKATQAPFYTGPFIGRQAEKEALTEFVAPLWQPSYAGAMIIAGEAGIGKSRLLHDFLQNSDVVKEHQVTIALCHTDQVLRRSFNPFRYWLRLYFGVSDTQVESRNKRSFNHTLDHLIEKVKDPQLAGELDRTRSFLAALVNLFWQDSLYEQLDPQGRYENTITALITLLKAESLNHPVILHLEDIHWLDEDSKTVLSRLNRILTADQSETHPIAMIGTSRQIDQDSPLGTGISHQYLKLEPMSDREITELTESHLQAFVENELSEFSPSLSEGNPFYAEQILFYMQEEDLLEQDQDQWKLKATGTPPTPTDVRALLVARIDQFPNEIKEMVLKA
jgi:class 3 adenylate cyclase